MTAPNSTNNVTVRKLASVADGIWNKSKAAFVDASGDSMTGRLTMAGAPVNQIIKGTGTPATSSTSGGTTTYYPAKWNFDLGIATPEAGDLIVIKIPCAGHSNGIFISTDNGTTYFPVAVGNGSGRLTTRYAKDCYVPLIFEKHESGDSDYCGVVTDIFPLTGATSRGRLDIGCWRVVSDYDSGNYYERLHHSNTRFYAGSTGCYPYSLVFLDNTGRYSMLVTSNPGNNTTNKGINTSGKFVYPAVSMYYNANNTANAGALVSSTQVYTAYASVDIRYSCNYVSTNFTTHKAVYLECTLNGDGTWSPTATLYTQTPAIGKYYIYMGIFYSDKPYLTLDPAHPLYYYDGTNLVSAEVARGDITAGTNNGELNVAGTDITVYTHPTDAGNKHIPAGGSSGQFLGYDSDGTAKWVANPNTDTKVKATAKTDNVNYKILATASASPTSGAATEAVYDTDITLNPSTNTISANVSGTAASAGKLTTARTTYVTLGTASTSTTRDWSGTTTIPVSGTLGIGNGGTGATSAAGARTNLDVYSKSETESLLNGKVVVVTQLPATGESGVTYYVKDTSSSAVDKYDEYIWAKDAGASTESWIHVGEKSIDLSNYVNTLSTSGSGPLVASLSKSGNTLTATMGTISIDDLSDWATETDVTVSSVTYHTWWPVAPTSSNQVYGLSIYNGKLYRIYNNKGTYSAQAYDANTTYTNKSLGQGYGTCATEAATAAKIVTMSDYALTTGGIVTVKFTNALCASATMNINGKGAKPIYIKGAAVNNDNAATVSAGDTAYFMYDGTAYHLLGTDRAATNPIVNISRSGTTFTATRLDGSTFTFTQQDNNTTYTQAKLGQGYGTCTTAEATAAKSVTLTGYELEPNGVVAVKFTNGLCTSATMSINGKTATPIYINGTAVTTTSCKEVLAGDLAFFIYDGSHYQFICTDRISKNGITGLSISGRTITYTRADGTTGTLTTQDTTYSFDGTYNASTNKAATVSTVTNAVNALDVSDITGFGAGKTLATLTETDGKIAATFQNISITKSQVSDFSHAHGNITNDGKVGTTADYAVVTTTGGAVTATSLATSSPTTSGNTLEFIDTVSQNSKGKISATKKKVTIDETLSSSSTNPVQNTKITEWINKILGIEGFTTSASSDANSYLGNVAMGNLGIANSIYTSKIYAYSDNEANADLKWDSSTATAEQLALYQMGKKFSSSIYAGAPGETIRIDISTTTYNYLRGIGFYVSVKDATSGATTVANAHLKEGTTEYQAYRVSTSGSWCVSVMSSTARLTVSLYIVPSDSNTKISVFGIRAIVSGAGDNNFALPGTSYDTEKLKTARQLAVSLSNTSTNTTFDGSADVTNIKTTGTLGLGNGGTNATSATGAEYNILSKARTDLSANAISDTYRIPFLTTSPSTSNGVIAGYRTPLAVWNYMKDKMSSDSNVNISGNSATASAAQTGSALETAIDNKAAKPVRLTFTLPVAPSGGTSVKYVKITATGGDYRQWLCSYNGNISSHHSTWLFRSYSTGESSRDNVTLIKNGTASERQWYCAAANTWYVKFTNTATTSSYQIVFNVTAIDTSTLPTLEAVDTMPDTATEITVYGVTKAEQLRTARQLAVSLSNTGTTTTFDGTANVTNIKVSGTLGVGNGGTGKASVTAGNYLVGNGSSALTEKTPAQVLSDIGAQAALSFEGTYNASTNKVATVSTVTNAIDALDVPASGTGAITGMGAGKTLASLTETNGKVAATFQDISITKSQVSDFSHTHGNIATGGTLTDTAAAAAGNDYVVIRDADNAKIQTSTIKGTDVADAVSKKHSHSTLTLSTTAQLYDGSHTLALPSTDPYTSARTPASHSHGNIQNGGTLQTSDVAIANGDKLVITDASDSDKVARTSVAFDGSTTTKALTQKGTFESFAKSSDITSAVQALDVSSVGGDGKYISAISETDGKISATATTMDTTPTANSTNAVTSGGVKTELDNRIDRYDAVYNRNNTAGEGWVKLADTKPYSSITQVDKPAIWDVMITRCTGETSSEQLCLNVRYESTGLPNVYFKRFYTVDRTSTHKFAVVVSGVGGGSASEGKVELWAFLENHWGSIAIREVAGSTSTTLYGMNKIQYNYYSYNLNGGTEKPVEDLENHIQVVDSTNVKMATDQDAAKKSDGVYYVVGYSYAAYSSSKTYTQTTSTGPFDDTNSCVYSSQPYYCTTTISTGEAWNSNHWAKIPTAVWTGTNSAITSLYAGLKIAIKVPSYGGSSATQININGLGAKTMLRNTGNYTSQLPTNSIVFLTYDGTYWRWADYNTDGQWYVCGSCSTAAATAAKVASANNYVLTAGNVILIRFTEANTSHTALTLNVNGQGAKPLYINGEASSTTNYTLPAGIWACYYSGTYWDVRTDGSYRFKSLTLDNPLSIANGGTGATTVSDARYNLDVYSKAEIDDDVVHKAGEEIITGRKIFRDSIGISYDDDGEIGYSTKVLGQLSRGASYNEWSAGDKDGHHYREWTIKVPYILGFGALRVKIASMGLLNALNGVSGTLEKTIVVSVGASQVYQNMGYYTIVDDGPATDFRISDLIINEASQSETKTEIKIRTMHPEYDYTALTVSVDAYGKFSHFEDIELGSENPDIVTGETYDTITGTSSDPTTVVTHQWSTVPKIQNSLGKDILVDGDIIQSSTNGNLSVRGSDVEVYAHPTQTAYTSKGTATKVPQITTDSTGHVTSISEVTISGVTPSSHASTATTYGIGTTSTYGHVKLATGDMNGATNTDGVAVSKNHTHSQYAPKASPALTGTPTAPTAADGTNTTQIATTAFVQSAVAQGLSVSDAMVYKGTITLGASSPGGLTVAADKGHTYKVIANGTTTSGYVDGVKVEAGDMVICNTDSTAAATSSNYSTIAAKWDFVQGNTDGVVVGPASATSGNVVLFDGATGKLIKDGGKLGTSAFKDVASSGNASTTQVVMGNDTRLTDARTPTSHTHGNISDGGAITSTTQSSDITIATGDKLLVTDSSNSNKVVRTGAAFDTTVTNTYLCKNGTFIAVKEADVTWGGSFRTDLSPVEAAGMARNIWHNPLPSAIKYEKTTDGGSTWTEVAVTDAQKQNQFNLTVGWNFGIANADYSGVTDTTLLRARITVYCMSSENVTAYENTWCYGQVKRLFIYCSKAGTANLLVEGQTGPHSLAHDDVWTTFGNYAIAGDGWNSIPFDNRMGGYSSQLAGSGYTAYRFTYWITSGTSPRIHINRIGVLPAITYQSRATAVATIGMPLAINGDGSGTIKFANQLYTARKLAVSLSNTSTDTSFNGSADVTNIKTTGTLPVANGGTGKVSVTANNFLVGNGTDALVEKTPSEVRTLIGAGTRWTAVTKGQTWSRLFYSVPSNSVEGSSGILAVSCTRGVVVCNATFLITASHSGASYSSIIELASCNYTQVRSRIVVNPKGNYYFEVYDTAQSIAPSTTQIWHCTFLPLLGADLTTYTEFTDGTTIPSGYTATNDFTTTGGNAAAAIKNITRSGTTFTATRQDGSTFTFTQQDSNTDTKVVATAKTNDNANYKILATASASPTSASATEAVYSPNIALNPSTNTISANITGYAYGLHNSNVIEHQGNKDTYPLHRIASYPDSLVTTQSPHADNSLILHLFSKGYSYSDYGIVMITVKIPSTVDNTHPPTINISWKLRSSGIPADAVQAVCIYSDGLWHVDVFFRIQHQYQLTVFNKLGSNGGWALYSSTDASGGTEIYSAYSGTENTAASTKLYNLPSYDSAANQRGDGSIVGTAITATTASNFDTSGGTIKSSLNAKVNIASDGVVATSNSHWDIIMQVATIASNGVHYKRWLCNSDGTSAFVDYRPNSDNAAFMLEAYAVKWNSYTDCKYKLLYWRSGKQTPYVAELIFNQAQGLFPETITWRDTGVADSAYKLTTARTTYVTLGTASTSTTRDWSGDTTIPVDGTLGVANGGTGKSTVAANNFLVGNLTGALVEKTPSEVRTLIGAGTSSLSIGTSSTEAAAGDHKHGMMHNSFRCTVPDQSSDTTWETNIGLENNGFWLKSLRMQHDAPNWLVNNFGAGIAFGGVDTKGVISLAYDNTAQVRFAGGNGQSPNWYWTLKGSSGKTYTLPSDTCSLQAAFSIKKNGATITPSDGVADIGYMPVTGTLSTSTVQGAIQALRVNPGGKMGSVQLSASTVDSTSIPAAWYNYIWIPHRTGAAEADNQNFGTLILTPMTSTPEVYVIEGSALNTSSPTYRISSLQAALPTTGTASTTYAINVGGNAATATSATTATNYNTNSGTIKTTFESKLDIAPVGVSGPNDLLTLVKSLGANNIRYRRWICASSGGSDNISNRPNSDQSPFMLEAFATRWISASDYQYELIYYKTNTPYPYLATIMQSTTSISWVYSADARNATSINGYSLVVGPYGGQPNTIYLD